MCIYIFVKCVDLKRKPLDKTENVNVQKSAILCSSFHTFELSNLGVYQFLLTQTIQCPDLTPSYTFRVPHLPHVPPCSSTSLQLFQQIMSLRALGLRNVARLSPRTTLAVRSVSSNCSNFSRLVYLTHRPFARSSDRCASTHNGSCPAYAKDPG